MECISVFDMLKIGVGPSSSHTLGPWKAALMFLSELEEQHPLTSISQMDVALYGSLSLTGKGHATDLAVLLGLSGEDPEKVPVEDIVGIIDKIEKDNVLLLGGKVEIPFTPTDNIRFKKKFLPFHANGMRFKAKVAAGEEFLRTYYSIGGGFVVSEDMESATANKKTFKTFPYPCQTGADLLAHCQEQQLSISELVLANERSQFADVTIDAELGRIWDTMLDSVYTGCHTEGVLPGGLKVRRRAYDICQSLQQGVPYNSPQEWILAIRNTEVKFRQILKWVSCFALAVNEVNAAMGRIVTAPTNGSAGVIPAVLMYYMVIENHEANFDHIKRFLLVASEIGSIFKKGATISAAMGGCQAEIGVSSAMAAGALTELMGGTPEQVLVAAEIAMEHHLGLTCDPIAGLVQVPCIERNSMGAIKAINAAELAMGTDPKNVKVPLDKVVQTMWDTAKDMSNKYKETSEGGLAIKVSLSDC